MQVVGESSLPARMAPVIIQVFDKFFDVIARFAKIPGSALLGMDIINSGKLDMDNILGRMTYTQH